ncbi:MAG TPA: class II fructose-bisphosphate aldolase [Candidatus Thermoplasmatota archaeon]|nr:class II fructose-bisphosphate aldolase [Candidatus Thermoplasmatota archaeon]
MTSLVARNLTELDDAIRPALAVSDGRVKVANEERLRGDVCDRLAWTAVFSPDTLARDRARWLLRAAAWEAGLRSASIHELYAARGRGEVPSNFTVPAVNVRGPTYDVARAAFRAASRLSVGTLIFELARSEVGYTDQRPPEYAAVVTAAALREGVRGPLFLQGDHYQFSPSKYPKDPNAEKSAIRALIDESLAGGYRNIDIDASTLVDLSKPTEREQQRVNATLTAEMTAHVRGAQPPGVTIGVGGEIGEVGKGNSRPEELSAYVEELLERLPAGARPGLSKVSVNTGSSHGGVVLPDGTIAKVKIDFSALETLSRQARELGMAGAVQHGASTLPEDLFDKFPAAGAAEIHLATGFQNLLFDHPAFPEPLRQKVVAWTKANCADERKPSDTEEQFVYKSRKKAMGPHKREIWSLPDDARSAILKDMEAKFELLFRKLAVIRTRELAARWALSDPAPPPPPGVLAPRRPLDRGMAKDEGE